MRILAVFLLVSIALLSACTSTALPAQAIAAKLGCVGFNPNTPPPTLALDEGFCGMPSFGTVSIHTYADAADRHDGFGAVRQYRNVFVIGPYWIIGVNRESSAIKIRGILGGTILCPNGRLAPVRCPASAN